MARIACCIPFILMFISTQSLVYAKDFRPKVSFTADVVEVGYIRQPDGSYLHGSNKWKLYTSPHGVRYDIQETSGGPAHIMITNFPKRQHWTCNAEEKFCMGYMITDFSGWVPDGEPCGSRKEATATKSGSENLHGRQVEKWNCDYVDGTRRTVWFDPKLQMGIREETHGEKGWVSELRNIKEGPLSDDLFQPPDGYAVQTF